MTDLPYDPGVRPTEAGREFLHSIAGAIRALEENNVRPPFRVRIVPSMKQRALEAGMVVALRGPDWLGLAFGETVLGVMQVRGYEVWVTMFCGY